jgi:dihydropyrimidinase
MTEELVIRGGTLVSERGLTSADVLVRGCFIEAIAPSIEPSVTARTLDARDCLVFPGFMDLHVHVGEKISGYELADDFESATRLALENGITCLGIFAHQGRNKVEDALDEVLDRAREKAHCDFTVHLAPTRFDSETFQSLEQLARRGAKTLKLYTTYREAGLYADPESLRSTLELAARLDLRVLVHCEDDDIVHACPNRPVEAEVGAIEALIEAATPCNAKVHIVHVSSPKGLSAAQSARRRGRLTVETCPQYLYLDESHVDGPNGHRFTCSPPLRSPAQKSELVAAVVRGDVDALATDHCPFHRSDKDRHASQPHRVPRGLPGLGALVPLAFELFESSLGPCGIARLLCSGPARIAGLHPRKGSLMPNSDADIAVLARNRSRRPMRSTSRDAHDPYSHLSTTLEVRHVIARGVPVIADGQWQAKSAQGRLAWRV